MPGLYSTVEISCRMATDQVASTSIQFTISGRQKITIQKCVCTKCMKIGYLIFVLKLAPCGYINPYNNRKMYRRSTIKKIESERAKR